MAPPKWEIDDKVETKNEHTINCDLEFFPASIWLEKVLLDLGFHFSSFLRALSADKRC